jgi:hypothetical protein
LKETKVDSIKFGKRQDFGNVSTKSFNELEIIFLAYVKHIKLRKNRTFCDSSLNRFFNNLL